MHTSQKVAVGAGLLGLAAAAISPGCREEPLTPLESAQVGVAKAGNEVGSTIASLSIVAGERVGLVTESRLLRGRTDLVAEQIRDLKELHAKCGADLAAWEQSLTDYQRLVKESIVSPAK